MDRHTYVDSGLVEGATYREHLASTNDLALELTEDANLALPHLVVTDHQSVGRGRGKNKWWSGDGALTFSLIVNQDRWGLSETDLPLVPLAIGVAVCDAIQGHTHLDDVGLKWPNDVHLASRKVCGVLVERGRMNASRLVLGVGVNVNNDIAKAPDDIRHAGISLAKYMGRSIDRDTMLQAIIEATYARCAQIKSEPMELHERVRALCVLTGKWVTLVQHTQETRGRCAGIARDGRLQLQTADGIKMCAAGVVRNFE